MLHNPRDSIEGGRQVSWRGQGRHRSQMLFSSSNNNETKLGCNLVTLSDCLLGLEIRVSHTQFSCGVAKLGGGESAGRPTELIMAATAAVPQFGPERP